MKTSRKTSCHLALTGTVWHPPASPGDDWFMMMFFHGLPIAIGFLKSDLTWRNLWQVVFAIMLSTWFKWPFFTRIWVHSFYFVIAVMPTHINPTKEYKRFNGRILLQLTIVILDTFLCVFCFLSGLPYVSFYKPHEFHQFHPYEILQQRWWASFGADDFCIIAVYF